MEKRTISASAKAKFFAGSLILPLSVLSLSGQAFSEQEESDIEEVLVSASLLPIAASRSANAITVIDSEQLKNRAAVSVSDLLRDIPGLAVSRSGVVGSQTQVRVRGTEANHLLVLIDGVEAGDPSQSDELNWATITASDIERIEVIRGPQSALRGSDAVAGVVNIITRSAKEPFSARFFAEAGSYGLHHSGITLGTKGDSTDLLLGASHLETDGENISRSGNEKDGYQNSSYRLKGSWTVNENLRLSTAGSYIHGMSEFDSDDDFDGLVEDQNKVSEFCNSTFRTQVDYQSSDGRYQHKLVYARAENINESYTDFTLGDVTSAIKDQYQYTGSVFWAGTSQRLSLLLEREEEDFQQRGEITSWGANPNQDRERDTDSVALEYRSDISGSMTFALSGRYDDNSEFDSAKTFRAEVVYQLNDTARLRSTFGTAVKNPTFSERFGKYTNFLGNPDLQPEESTSWELGVDRELAAGKLTVSATLFDAELENEINGFVFDAESGGFTSGNTDGISQRQGVELGASGVLSDNLSFSSAYTYTDSVESDGAGGFQDEIRRPRHTASVNISWQATDKLHINTNAQFSGGQTDEFFTFPSEIVKLDDYTLLNVNADYKATDKLDIYLRLDNLLDDQYEEVFGYRTLGFGANLGLRYSL